jgi:hypothetical protein
MISPQPSDTCAVFLVQGDDTSRVGSGRRDRVVRANHVVGIDTSLDLA